MRDKVLKPVAGSVITLDCAWMGNPSIFGTQLYVRKCYPELLESSEKFKNQWSWMEGTLIAGTPGA